MIELKVGTLVLLTLDSPGAVGITEGLYEYKDRMFRIGKVKTFQGDGRSVTRGTYYELKGLKSEAGTPYAVTADWIRPVRELER